LIPDASSRTSKFKFDEERFWENEGFKAIGDREVAIEELSAEQQAHRFGIMTADFVAG
jgi:hypothetical protein